MRKGKLFLPTKKPKNQITTLLAFFITVIAHDPHLAIRACVLHPMFPSVITHIIPNQLTFYATTVSAFH